MQDRSHARWARAAGLWLTALVAMLAAAPEVATAAHGDAGLSPRLLADASWHGRPIRQPWPASASTVHTDPALAETLGRGTGYATPGGAARVREVQRRLRRLGYRPGRVDGLFGPRTQAAVLAFQRKHALPRTGEVGRSTLRVLRARTDAPVAGRTAVRTARPREEAPAATQPRAPDAPAAAAAGAGSGVEPAVARAPDGGLDVTPLALAMALAVFAGAVLVAWRVTGGDDDDGLAAPWRVRPRARWDAAGRGGRTTRGQDTQRSHRGGEGS